MIKHESLGNSYQQRGQWNSGRNRVPKSLLHPPGYATTWGCAHLNCHQNSGNIPASVLWWYRADSSYRDTRNLDLTHLSIGLRGAKLANLKSPPRLRHSIPLKSSRFSRIIYPIMIMCGPVSSNKDLQCHEWSIWWCKPSAWLWGRLLGV
jgi:hypothetical protein